ncbi:unnamed protein product [Cuscuta epithymum]|uniref:Retrotransposon Copia-like N-terminal domain-containing protein n=1 Tax=Cuscuta epithymum TaxID=186058 RepID=A0AAV0ELL8_9ASTE|nr:unnamed protein product [Cuscuta epithymum]
MSGSDTSTVTQSQPLIVSEVIPINFKITENKLCGSNYLEWSKTIKRYLRSIDKHTHLVDDPPKEEVDRVANTAWLRDDSRLFIQIQNSMENEVMGYVSHCDTVKELFDYLEFMYSGKGNLNDIYEVCKAFYRAEMKDKPLTAYFMDFKKTYEELNTLMPFSPDIKVQQKQREQMAVMSFLAGLTSEFETAKSFLPSILTCLLHLISRLLYYASTCLSYREHQEFSSIFYFFIIIVPKSNFISVKFVSFTSSSLLNLSGANEAAGFD